MPPSAYAINVRTTPAVRGLHRMVVTDIIPTAAFRGAARRNANYIVERLVDDRLDLSQQNIIWNDSDLYRILVGSVYDSSDM